MLEIETFPGYAPGLRLQGMVAESLLSPRLTRMKMSFDRLAARSAAEQGIEPSPDCFALWARLTDGSVLGLQRVEGVWELTRVPVPAAAVRLLDLPDVTKARYELLWVEIAPNRVDLLRNGECQPLWQAELAPPISSELPAPDLS